MFAKLSDLPMYILKKMVSVLSISFLGDSTAVA